MADPPCCWPSDSCQRVQCCLVARVREIGFAGLGGIAGSRLPVFETPSFLDEPAMTLGGPALAPAEVVVSLDSGPEPLTNEVQPAAVSTAEVHASGHETKSTISWLFWLWLAGVCTIGLLLFRRPTALHIVI